MHSTFRTLTACLFLLASIQAAAQDNYQTLPGFEKIEIGPNIIAILEQGDQEDIRYELNGIHPDELHVESHGNKLNVYLDKARHVEKQKKIYDNGYKQKVGWYDGDKVNVYITYQTLKKIVFKGEEKLDIHGTITDDIFKMKIYGDSDVEIENLRAERLKVKMYGESTLKFKNGAVGLQKYTLYGENTVHADGVASAKVKATNYGETELNVNTERLKFTVFGEIYITCGPGTDIRKGLVFGESSINKY
jgi:putative autotransporter adhesin-like protein